MKRRRGIALLLAAAMLLALLSGCGGYGTVQTGGIAGGSGTHQSQTGTTEFQNAWRDSVDYADMEYVHYEPEQLEAYTAPIYEIAVNGGETSDFRAADDALTEELYKIYTYYTLAMIRSYDDYTDEAAAEEMLYAQNAYYDANETYWAAMHAVAVSDYADVMDGVYSAQLQEWFAEYEPEEDETDRDRNNRETQLEQEYFTLIGSDDPDYDRIGELFVELVALRNEKARERGYDSYADYAYASIYAKDYTPEDGRQVWEGTKASFVPLMQRYGSDILAAAGRLNRSDRIDCAPETILNAMGETLPQLAEELAEPLDYMTQHGLYDIAQSGTKSNMGFTTLLYEYNEPFIFNAGTGTYQDYTDMFHEFGHYVNYYYTQSDLLFGASDNDLSELQSQGMEMLFTYYYEDIFGEADADTIRDYVLLSMVFSVVDGALYDEFQQRVYAEEDLTPQRVDEIFAQLYEEYGYEPYDGYEREWMGISHNFDSPFYYISYAVSALGALEIYGLCQEDLQAGVDQYLKVAAMDTEVYYYSEALEEAGLRDVFQADSYAGLAEALEVNWSGRTGGGKFSRG